MIFSEIYGAYYNAIAQIINEAIKHPISSGDIRRIVEKHAYQESILNIEPALLDGRWQLLRKDGTTIINNEPSMPLTLIQKRFLKAISMDPRVRLFTDDVIEYEDVKPLFTPDDYIVFDKYLDGDDFEDENYIKNFRFILNAIHSKTPIAVHSINRKGRPLRQVLIPKYLEYSEKDDKFRVYGMGKKGIVVANVGKIIECEKFEEEYEFAQREVLKRKAYIIFELKDVRKALERVMLHFAHFEKEVERIEENKYRVKLYYYYEDKTEMVIRILSYGPMIKVVAPQKFVGLIKERLILQKNILTKKEDI